MSEDIPLIQDRDPRNPVNPTQEKYEEKNTSGSHKKKLAKRTSLK